MQNIQIRQKALLQIIGQEAVFSQEELQMKLSQMGITTTQATLSRDLKALHIIKVPGEGYRMPQPTRPVQAAVPQGILSIEFSGQNAVLKTQPGFAPAVASYIDHHPSRPVMATLAGDDVVLLILRQGYGADETLDALSTAFPHIKEFQVL